jgi:hypothetical protein
MAKWTEEKKAEAKLKYAERIAKLDLVVEEALAEPTETKFKEFSIFVPEKEIEVAVQPKEEEYLKPMGMDYECKIQSMTNAVKILPPNMIKDGRHLRENIQAICGFMVSDEMMDEVYKSYTHPVYD